MSKNKHRIVNTFSEMKVLNESNYYYHFVAESRSKEFKNIADIVVISNEMAAKLRELMPEDERECTSDVYAVALEILAKTEKRQAKIDALLN